MRTLVAWLLLLLLLGTTFGFQTPIRATLPLTRTTLPSWRLLSTPQETDDPAAFRNDKKKKNIQPDDNKNNKNNNNNNNNNSFLSFLVSKVTRLFSRLTLVLTRLPARFAAASRRGKLIMVAQFAIVVALLFGLLTDGRVMPNQHVPSPLEVPYSHFLDMVEDKKSPLRVANVRIGANDIFFDFVRASNSARQLGHAAFCKRVVASPDLIDRLRKHGVPFGAATPITSSASVLSRAVQTILLCFYGLLLFRVYSSLNGRGGEGSSGPGKLAKPSDLPKASFDDIQGIDKAKFEVMELVDTLRNPNKYAILGARAPKGLLLEGPPGTGKTMLARATAAAAGVPLLYCSGSDFVEMYVGRGAARVRKTFAKAARLAPCLVFVDEIDALGKARSSVGLRDNDEAEQTLNQLLACMDGIDSSKKGICVMAATNRKDVLDPALLRPGRFDRMVRLELPDAVGRERILRVHAKNLPGVVDLAAVAAVTPGLSGAELEYIVNEAAIRAVRRVSHDLREQGTATARVLPQDFEASVRDFYQSRQQSSQPNIFKLLQTILSTPR